MITNKLQCHCHLRYEQDNSTFKVLQVLSYSVPGIVIRVPLAGLRFPFCSGLCSRDWQFVMVLGKVVAVGVSLTESLNLNTDLGTSLAVSLGISLAIGACASISLVSESGPLGSPGWMLWAPE